MKERLEALVAEMLEQKVCLDKALEEFEKAVPPDRASPERLQPVQGRATTPYPPQHPGTQNRSAQN